MVLLPPLHFTEDEPRAQTESRCTGASDRAAFRSQALGSQARALPFPMLGLLDRVLFWVRLSHSSLTLTQGSLPPQQPYRISISRAGSRVRGREVGCEGHSGELVNINPSWRTRAGNSGPYWLCDLGQVSSLLWPSSLNGIIVPTSLDCGRPKSVIISEGITRVSGISKTPRLCKDCAVMICSLFWSWMCDLTCVPMGILGQVYIPRAT